MTMCVRRNLTASVAIASAVVLMTGCAAAKAEPNAVYESVLDLRDSYLAAEVSDEECDDDVTQDALEQWGWQTVNCGMHTILVVYETQDAMDQHLSKSFNHPEEGEAELRGKQWSITTQAWNIKTVQDALGGELVQGSGSKF